MNEPPQIVLADDDPLLRQTLARALERLGFSVVACADGAEALRALEGLGREALLVLDYEMPVLDGPGVCKAVRAHADAGIAQTPILLLTAHTDEAHEIAGLRAGADDFVTKPPSLAVLHARIETQRRLAALRGQLRARNRQLAQWRELHEMDMEAARLVQRAILSRRMPEMAGWEFAAYHRSLIQVGGDIYDWLRLPGGGLLVWIADATGHGVSAALLTAFTKLLFRYAANEVGQMGEPDRILRLVNDDFRAFFKGHSFLTAACIVLEPETGRFRAAAAGHPPLVLLRESGGAPESIASTAPPVGLLLEADKPHPVENALAPGDTLLMLTDGLYSLVDARGERLSFERLLESLRGCRPPGAQAAIQEVLARVADAAGPGETFDDDVAMLAVRRKQSPL